MIERHTCRYCRSPDIDAEERVPRFIAIAIDGIDEHGELGWHYDPTNRDEAVWEGSETIGFRCAFCDEAADNLADLVQAAPGVEEGRRSPARRIDRRAVLPSAPQERASTGCGSDT